MYKYIVPTTREYQFLTCYKKKKAFTIDFTFLWTFLGWSFDYDAIPFKFFNILAKPVHAVKKVIIYSMLRVVVIYTKCKINAFKY